MPDNSPKIKILIASPSDVKEERKRAVEVIRLWNASHPAGAVFEAVLWESHATPQGGGNPQKILNQQIVDQCDCAVGIFWSRIGTPTPVARGGAVEEIERLEAFGKHAMLYFSRAELPTDVDLDQLKQLRAFRSERDKTGLCCFYTTLADFEKELRQHLDLLISRLSGSLSRTAVESEETRRLQKNLRDEKRYRDKLHQELSIISLLGSGVIQPFHLKLSDLFVPLRMYDAMPGKGELEHSVEGKRGDEEAAHLPDHVMKEAFRKCSTLLVIGDPGSGKTTLMKYYGLTALEQNPPEKLGFQEPVKLFYLPLRELEHGKQGYKSLPSNLAAWSRHNYLTLGTPLFQEWLDNHPSLVLLDGLDEVSDPSRRKEICAWIKSMSALFANARFVVTSRKTGYRQDEGITLDFEHQRVDVMDFSFPQQQHFLDNWYKAAFLHDIRPEECPEELWKTEQLEKAKRLADAMVDYLKKPENKGIRELAAVPMLLQIMAILWKERKFLPGRRQELYTAALDYLLDYRDTARNLKPLLCAEDARRVLAPAALWMQEKLERDEASRSEMQLQMQQKLDAITNSPAAEEFCRNMVYRAGVLVEQGKHDYIFRHKTFREYLAAVQLEKEWHEEGRIKTLVRHFGEESGWWDEVIRFFIAQSSEKIFDLFMKELFSSPVSSEFSPKQKRLLLALVEEAPEKKVEALCEALCRSGETTHFRQRSILDCLKAVGLPKAIEALQTFKTNRLALNRDVSALADDVRLYLEKKAGKVSVTLPCESEKLGTPSSFRNRFEHDAQYILIPGGRYIYSQSEEEVSVPDLYVAKYPVTNRQYRTFIAYLRSEAPEHQAVLPLQSFRETLYALAEKKEKEVPGLLDYIKGKNNLADRFRSGKDDDRKFNRDDQPVVSVNWFNATAYTLWLSMLEGWTEGMASGGEMLLYRLPEEIEWEWVAGGQRERVGEILKVKLYPWGEEEPAAKHANFGFNEGATMPVGSYPAGATPEGLYDMAGNVWEWMRNKYKKNTSARALRGGSWGYDPDALRCDARVDYPPGFRDCDAGFRVVRSSHSCF
ncbi:MAG: SUMF1/EgtB/PvdO family nonheme iron enzyme [Chlorobium sp.]